MSLLSLVFPADRYNLDFDMTGCIIMLVLICLESFRIKRGKRAAKTLLVLDVSLLISCAMRTAMLFLCNTPELFEMRRAELTLVVSNLGKYWSISLLFCLLLLLLRDGELGKCQQRLVFVPPAILTALILLPTTRSLLFSFSAAGKIVRGPAYPILIVYALAYFSLSTATVVILRKRLSRGRFALMLLAMAITIVGYIADIADPSIKSANFAMVLLLLVMFEVLYDKDYESSVRSGQTDSLTGLCNRAALRTNFPGFVGQMLCVAMLDIDKFKHFNDEMGHERGDQILAGTGRVIRDQFGDDGYRYGGDEFLVVTSMDEREFLARLERVRKGISSLSGAAENDTVHATIGYAFGNPTSIVEVRALVGRADRALYEGKGNGGNMLSGETISPEQEPRVADAFAEGQEPTPGEPAPPEPVPPEPAPGEPVPGEPATQVPTATTPKADRRPTPSKAKTPIFSDAWKENFVSLFRALSPKLVDEYRGEVLQRNSSALALYLSMGTVVSAVSVFIQLLVERTDTFAFNVAILALCTAGLLLSRFVPFVSLKHSTLALYLCEIPVLVIGALMGTVFDPDVPAQTFMLLIVVLPMFILDKAWRLELFVSLSSALFAVLAVVFKDPQVAGLDLVHLFGFVAAQVLMNLFVLADRMRSVVYRVESEREERRSERLANQVIEALSGAIDAKSPYTKGHSDRVADFARDIAREAGYDERGQRRVYIMAQLHDIGKIGIDESILDKPGKLTDGEFAAVRTHPVIGDGILQKITSWPGLEKGARWHHERWDGKGYPDGLSAEEIPEEARIIAVADAYDAMTSDRSYRGALREDEVRAELLGGSGTQFDPRFVQIALKLMGEWEARRARREARRPQP